MDNVDRFLISETVGLPVEAPKKSRNIPKTRHKYRISSTISPYHIPTPKMNECPLKREHSKMRMNHLHSHQFFIGYSVSFQEGKYQPLITLHETNRLPSKKGRNPKKNFIFQPTVFFSGALAVSVMESEHVTSHAFNTR